MTISEALQKLETLQKQLYAYGHAMSILYIDAVTAAPPDTAAGRGETLGVLSAASYQLKTDPSARRSSSSGTTEARSPTWPGGRWTSSSRNMKK